MTIQGIIHKGAINMETQFERLSYVSSNVSNYNTSGYKGVRFEQMLNENGYLTGYARTDFSPGTLMRTERPLDIALDGTGFIPVTSPTGAVAYTREGSLTTNKDGYLMTNDGWLVGDGIQLPANYDNVAIKADGNVEVYSNDGTLREVIGKIPVVNFRNPEGLKQGDYNKYYLTADSGEPVLIKKHKKFRQGSIEMTNVDMMNEADEMMRINASMTASLRVLQTVNDMYSQVIQLNQ